MNIFKALFNRPAVHKEKGYGAAFRYKNKFAPKDDANYAWIESYAEFNFRQLKESNDTLDAKAESLIRVFAGGSGLLSIGATLKISEVSFEVTIFWAAAIILAVMAVVTAVLVRYPRDVYFPPSIFFAIQYAEEFGDKSKARFLPQWHLACEGIRLSNGRKAAGLKIATWFGVSAIVVLALSFCVAIYTMGNAEKTNSKVSQPMPDQEQPIPDPATQPQTIEPDASANAAETAGPQQVQNGNNPAIQAGPQSLMESEGSE